MGKYKIVFSKEECIGSKNCEVVSPELWKVVGNKSILKGAVLNKSTGKYELEIDDSKLEKQKLVVKSCPVNCITIEQA